MCSHPTGLTSCLHHLHLLCILLRGLAGGVCESSIAYVMESTTRQKRKSCLLVLLVQDPFLVASFLLFCYNGSASIINKSSAPALTAFLQGRTKYSMVFLQLILHLSLHGLGAHFSILPACWVLLWWDCSVPNISCKSDDWSYFWGLVSLGKLAIRFH